VLDQCLHRAFDQQPQDRIGISAAGTSHADRLCQDAGRIGSASGNALHSSDQVIDSGKWTVWHGARLSDTPTVTPTPRFQTAGV
jgi:hypothetical protein